MMKIKERIKIGGHIFRVEFPYSFMERTDLSGQCDVPLLTIRIADVDGGGNRIPETRILQAFMHELIHAVDSIYCARRIRDKTIDDPERVIDALAEGLVQVLLENWPLWEEE